MAFFIAVTVLALSAMKHLSVNYVYNNSKGTMIHPMAGVVHASMAIFKRIGEKVLGTHSDSGIPMKERVANAIGRLQIQQSKIEKAVNQLQRRDQELFDRCVRAQMAKDSSYATIYANECAEIRKIAKIMIHSQLALERVVLRLETAKQLGDMLSQMGPVINIVKDVRSQLSGILPEVSIELSEVNNLLGDTLVEAGGATAKSLDIKASDVEAKRIVDEANAIAEQRVRERFPEVPTTPLPSTEEKVYDYIIVHGREVSLSECADALDLSPLTVREAIESLQQKGRIQLELE